MADTKTQINMKKQFAINLIDFADNLEKYKTLKKEFFLYIQGSTRNNSHVKDTMKNFFRHLEDMIFGTDIDINETGFL